MVWDQYVEKRCVQWGQKFHERSLIHSFASTYYMEWSRLLGVPSVILNAIIASTTFATYNGSDDVQADKVIRLALGVLLLLSTALMSANQFLRFKPLSSHHSKMTSEYNKLAVEIEEQLAYPRLSRVSTVEFMTLIRKRSNELRELEMSNPVPDRVINKYYDRLDRLIAVWKPIVNAHRHPDANSASTNSSKNSDHKDKNDNDGNSDIPHCQLTVFHDDEKEEEDDSSPRISPRTSFPLTDQPDLSPRFKSRYDKIQGLTSSSKTVL